MQSRRVYEEDGVWPSLYGGEGGGHGYVSAEKNKQITIPINTQIAMRHKRMGEGTRLGVGENGDPAFTLQAAHSHAVISTQAESNTSVAFACNQRDEVRDLNNVTGAIQAQPGMKQQTFIVDSADITTFHINQRDEIIDLHGISGALLATCNMQMQTFISEPVLCLNDRGGSVMDVSHNVTGTLRARMDGHPPLVLGNDPELFENHGIDSRYTGPHEVAPTMSARYGTGGNNVPLISQQSVFLADSGEDLSPAETYCIAGNIIDRQDHNGGNGMGFQPDISYTLNTADRHCVFSQQRSDEYAPNNVVSTQSARQYKDATDLVCETDVAGLDCRNGTENGNLSGTLQSKTDGGYSLNNVHPVRIGKLIRRLTPLECERLQGFPDYWTDIPGASDSARYKALGNSVAIPCVEHVLRGIAYFLRKFKQEWEESECIPTSPPTT